MGVVRQRRGVESEEEGGGVESGAKEGVESEAGGWRVRQGDGE